MESDSDFASAPTVTDSAAATDLESTQSVSPSQSRGLLTGTTLADRYDVIDLLGVGGMGEVYRARDRELDELVALKLLRSDVAGLPAWLARFRNEVRLARRVTHRNVARTFELGETGGTRFLTMELVDGESVGSILERRGALDTASAARIGLGVAEALAAAHAVGVVHRDVKPDNVMVARDGRVVVTDFGIAHETRDDAGARTFAGTPAYMAPEQAAGEPATPLSDLYALGVTLFEMVTGSLPFDAPSPAAILAARLLVDPPDVRERAPGVSPAFAEIIKKAMAKDPALRYPSVAVLATSMSAVLTGAGEVRPLELEVLSLPAGAIRTVVVLPFAEPLRSTYLTEALFDRVTRLLGRVPRLRVLPRAFVDPTMVEASEDVEVGDLTVSGLRSGESEGDVVISGLDARGRQRFRFELSVGPARIDAIAETLARATAAALELDSPADATTLPQRESKVLDLVLRAGHKYNKAFGEDLREAVRLLEEALVLAPNDPRVLAGFSMALARSFFYESTRDATLDRADAASRRALELSPKLAEAHLARGHLALHRGEPVLAAGRFREALGLAPQRPDVHEWIGRLLLEIGNLRDALPRVRMAMRIDARAVTLQWEVARAWALLGEWDQFDAIVAEIRRRTTGFIGRFAGRVRHAAWRGDVSAFEALEEEFETTPNAAIFDQRLSRALLDVYHLGRYGEVRATLAEACGAKSSPSLRRVAFTTQLFAEAAAFAGDVPTALGEIERADAAGLIDLHWVDRCPLLERLHAEPRFVAARARVAQRAEDILTQLYGT
jgi:eukaryotic-like serine/threonine-protein kinase